MPDSYDATNDIYGPEGPPTISSLIAASVSRNNSPQVGSRLRTGPLQQPATHGSRTITIDPAQSEEDSNQDDHVLGVLELRGESNEGRRVQWDDDVVDNEHMGKKKSKICCIFKRQKEFGESSDESSSDSDSDSSGSESDGGPTSSSSGNKSSKDNDKRKGSNGPCNHPESDHHHHHHHHSHGDKKKKKRVLNEYERMPKAKTPAQHPINQDK
ncbi:Type 1 phosphatases regulator ypi1 [Entomortierella beljakovae]|nr:Type 1 phosphatases regulator ypi1 [Entomortierella beljakovae]